MKNGWVKLYRKILESDMYKSLNAVQRDVLITCLLLVNHKSHKWEWQGKIYEVNEGEFITSLNSLKEKCAKDTSIQNIRTALDKLIKWQFLTNESTKTGRLIKIVNWGKYQDTDNGLTKQLTKNQQRANKELTTNKNDKKDKNDKKEKNKKNIRAISKHFKNQIKENALLTDSARKKIKTRLKTFSVEELKQAIDNFCQDSWHMEHNGHRPMSWFFHNNERIESYRDMIPRKGGDGRGKYRSDNQPEKGKYDKYRQQ